MFLTNFFARHRNMLLADNAVNESTGNQATMTEDPDPGATDDNSHPDPVATSHAIDPDPGAATPDLGVTNKAGDLNNSGDMRLEDKLLVESDRKSSEMNGEIKNKMEEDEKKKKRVEIKDKEKEEKEEEEKDKEKEEEEKDKEKEEKEEEEKDKEKEEKEEEEKDKEKEEEEKEKEEENESLTNKEKIRFDDILKDLGDFGHYQKIIYFFLFMPTIFRQK
jgi:flagellar biosynthesis GTPase FlhF